MINESPRNRFFWYQLAFQVFVSTVYYAMQLVNASPTILMPEWEQGVYILVSLLLLTAMQRYEDKRVNHTYQKDQ